MVSAPRARLSPVGRDTPREGGTWRPAWGPGSRQPLARSPRAGRLAPTDRRRGSAGWANGLPSTREEMADSSMGAAGTKSRATRAANLAAGMKKRYPNGSEKIALPDGQTKTADEITSGLQILFRPSRRRSRRRSVRRRATRAGPTGQRRRRRLHGEARRDAPGAPDAVGTRCPRRRDRHGFDAIEELTGGPRTRSAAPLDVGAALPIGGRVRGHTLAPSRFFGGYCAAVSAPARCRDWVDSGRCSLTVRRPMDG